MAKYVHTGENPGYGAYCCTNCGTDIRVDGEEKIPACPKCTNTSFARRR